MTNDAIMIGLANDSSALKRLSLLSYKYLKRYNTPSIYKLCAISKAAGILASRKKSIKRGYSTKQPYVRKLLLVSCYGFKIANGMLIFPIERGSHEFIPLNNHTLEILKDETLTVRSFTLTEKSLSLCIAKEITDTIHIAGAFGIDRNLRNLTCGNKSEVIYYNMSKIVDIGEATKGIVRSFKRNDRRIRKEIGSKYGKRKRNRTNNILNRISSAIVKNAKENRQAIVFEDIKHIRNLYKKGNGQSRDFRRQMNNHWPFAEIKRRIVYKAQWAGIPVIHLTKGETRGTSLQCVKCGERLQSPFKDDVLHKRQLWCSNCKRWCDRDLVAVMNISRRGWLRFSQSKGIGSEAMVQEREWMNDEPLILKVDPMKSTFNGVENH